MRELINFYKQKYQTNEFVQILPIAYAYLCVFAIGALLLYELSGMWLGSQELAKPAKAQEAAQEVIDENSFWRELSGEQGAATGAYLQLVRDVRPYFEEEDLLPMDSRSQLLQPSLEGATFYYGMLQDVPGDFLQEHFHITALERGAAQRQLNADSIVLFRAVATGDTALSDVIKEVPSTDVAQDVSIIERFTFANMVSHMFVLIISLLIVGVAATLLLSLPFLLAAYAPRVWERHQRRKLLRDVQDDVVSARLVELLSQLDAVPASADQRAEISTQIDALLIRASRRQRGVQDISTYGSAQEIQAELNSIEEDLHDAEQALAVSRQEVQALT